jgi:hypothetical protein
MPTRTSLAVPLCATLTVFAALATPAGAQTTIPSQALISIDSEPGDYVGGGETLTFTQSSAAISIRRVSMNAIDVVVQASDAFWTFTFSAPSGTTIAPGTYAPARRAPFTTFVGLDISGNSRGCNALTGRFIVYDVQYASDGSVTRFAADAEQHCEDQTPATFAAIRIDSALQPTPFSGQYPWYELTVDSSVNGTVTGGPLNCGSAGDSCWVTFLGRSQLTLTATPDPGYTFTGWTGACSGGPTITLNVNTTMRCAALFEPDPPIAPRTVLYWDSTSVDALGRGETETYNDVNSRWTFTRIEGNNGLEINIDSIAEKTSSRWNLQFRAPAGQELTPGSYEGVVRAPFRTSTPGLEAYGNGNGCNAVVGRFRVHEIFRDGAGNITSLAVDFEHRCDFPTGAKPPLLGTLRYNSTVPIVPAVVSLTPSTVPQAGHAITWTAAVIGGAGPLQYRFWRQDHGVWSMVRDYAASNQYTWTPTASDVGGHALQVWVRNAGSTSVYDGWRGITFDVAPPPPPPGVTSLTANRALPAPAGGPITWTAVASGGIAPLQYQFWRLDAGVWKMVQGYSVSASYTWTPGIADVGEHSLQVWVRSAESSAPYDAWRGATFTITGPPPLIAHSLTTTSAPPLQAGTAHTWTAVASGGLAPLQYQFWRRDPDGWKMVRGWNTSPSYTWTPTLADAGPHDLQVWVRNAGSIERYDAWRGASFVIAGPPPIVASTLTTASPSPLQAGSAHTWTAVASGGVAPLQYQFWRRDPDGWKMVRDWNTSPSYTWTPTLTDAGPHDLQVWVRSAGSSERYDAWRGASFEVVVPPISMQFLVNATFPHAAEIEIEWRAIASAGGLPLEYKYWRLDGNTWTVVQDFSANSFYRWTPTVSDAGTHAIQVWVRRVGSTSPYDTWAGSGLFVINP